MSFYIPILSFPRVMVVEIVCTFSMEYIGQTTRVEEENMRTSIYIYSYEGN